VLDDEGLARERPDVAIVGAPYDEGTSHRPGSRFGPNAIRAATYHAGSSWLRGIMNVRLAGCPVSGAMNCMPLAGSAAKSYSPATV